MKTFEEMSKIDVSDRVEKKGKFSYLSWPYAVSEFRKNCPGGVWNVARNNGSPVITTDHGHFVEVVVTPDIAVPELSFSQIHPILDSNNRPIQSPNAFQVNTSIQRCLVKAIALATGLGLYVYAGEDLPEQSKDDATDKGGVPTITVDQEMCIAEWKARCDAASKENDLAGFREWFVKHSDFIHKDCGLSGKKVISDYCAAIAKA